MRNKPQGVGQQAPPYQAIEAGGIATRGHAVFLFGQAYLHQMALHFRFPFSQLLLEADGTVDAQDAQDGQNQDAAG